MPREAVYARPPCLASSSPVSCPTGGLDPLVAAGHELVQREGDEPYTADELAALAGEVDAIVCILTDRIDAAVLHAGAPRLRVVANVAVGYDNIDVATATELGIAVCNTPGVLDETTADLAFLLLLAACRRATDAEADLRAGRWTGFHIGDFLGVDVHGATLGIVGYGRIGQAVARRAAGFGMEVLHHTRTDTGITGWVQDLDDLLRRADIVSLHVPLHDATRGLIDARRLALDEAVGGVGEHRARPGGRRGGARGRARGRHDLRRRDRRLRTRTRGAPAAARGAARGAAARTSAAPPKPPAAAWRSSRARVRSPCSRGDRPPNLVSG